MTRHFLVIGAQRSGTTFLHSLLGAHPGIAMARPTRPEPKVFLQEVAGDLGWYEQTYFAHAAPGQVLGEKSTSYIEVPQAATRARALLGECDVVAVLRDPIDRAVSNWRFSTDHGMEARPLEEALRANLVSAEPWDPAHTSVSPYSYLERGRFADQLPAWQEVFGDRVHVLYFDELVASPAPAARLYGVLGAVGEPPGFPSGAVNQSIEAAPALDPGFREELEDYFRDSDERLAALLGTPPPWRTAR